MSFFPKTAAILSTKTAKNISLIIGIATIIYAALN
jgi:hypothetical protein